MDEDEPAGVFGEVMLVVRVFLKPNVETDSLASQLFVIKPFPVYDLNGNEIATLKVLEHDMKIIHSGDEAC